MIANWEKIEKNVGVLDVEIDAEQVARALDKAFRKVVQKVNVPGFS
jgi:trigger factor